MASGTIVVKLGGDALATPERLAAQARRLSRRAGSERLVAVASARRGVTDHLLGLVRDVREAVGGGEEGHAEADRAVASGEVVTSALLALALTECGAAAVSLDARDAGIQASGTFGDARIESVAAKKLNRLLDRGVLPVVTGFQGWRNGRVATLGRGGSDTSAVALAAALGASRCDFVKDAAGLLSADPKIVPDARPIPRASHRFLTRLAEAGARVVHQRAAQLAEEEGIPLAFFALEGESPFTLIDTAPTPDNVFAVAGRELPDQLAQITVVREREADDASGLRAQLTVQLTQAGIHSPRWLDDPGPLGVIVTARDADEATRAIHRWLVAAGAPALTRRAS